VFDNQTFHQKLASELSAFDEAKKGGERPGVRRVNHPRMEVS